MITLGNNKLFLNKTALITGGSDGIGFSTAKLFAEQGARKIIITGRDQSRLDAACSAIPGQVVAVSSDASKLADIKALFQNHQVIDAPIDTLVVNAGAVDIESITEVTEESFDRQFDTNVKGAYFLIKESLPFLAEKDASIILVSSIAAHIGLLNLSVYSAAKAALASMARTLGSELAGKGIRVNTVSPGYIATPLSQRKNTQEAITYVSERTPFQKRGGEPEEVAMAILCFAVGLPFVTGQDLSVDGGLSLQSTF